MLGAGRAPGRSPRFIMNEARAHGLTWLCALQGYCWEPLNVPADLLIHRPISTDAGEACSAESVRHVRAVPELTLASVASEATASLRTALAALPAQQRRPGHKLALLVPYRGRPEHLAEFLPHIHAYLTVRDASLCGDATEPLKDNFQRRSVVVAG